MSTKEINLKSKIVNPTLSLCMIVKDEEKFLPGCLDSVKDFVDEIIIVDTGSTDGTVEIAKRYNAKVYHHPWENSFSKARNYSLKYATCDWIFWLDADEEVDKDDAYKLREVIKEPVGCETTHRVNVILVPMFDRHIGDNEDLAVFNSQKIFRNHLGFYFEGIVHNKLITKGANKHAAIKIYHYGYHLSDEQMKRKFIRTSTLLKEQIRDNPENPVPHHFLSISYLNRNMDEECIKEAREAIKLYDLENDSLHPKLFTYCIASLAHFRMNDLVNAENYALKAIDLNLNCLDAYYMLSSIYFLNNEYSNCVKATEKYFELLKVVESDCTKALTVPQITYNGARLAHLRMSIIFYERGKDGEGERALKNAIECANNVWESYLTIGKHFHERGDYDKAERFFNDGLMLDPKNKNILYYISEMHEKKGEMDKAILQLKNIIMDHPDEIPAQYRLGLFQLKGNRFDEAINSFKSVIDKQPHHMGALFSLAAVYESVGDNTNAKYTYNDILTIEPENPEALVKMGYLHMDNANYAEAKECFLNTIKLDKYLIDAYLALSKINISLNDLNGCVMNCDRLLKCLNLPRNVTIDSMSDLSNLYNNIGETLLKKQKDFFANMSFEIGILLDPGTV